MRLSEELRDRTKRFSSSVIRLFIDLPKSREEVKVIGKQLLRSANSVAAHAREASRARSEAEFCSKLDVLIQEADESQLWLEHLVEDCSIPSDQIQPIHQECGELMAIFISIVVKVKRGNT